MSQNPRVNDRRRTRVNELGPAAIVQTSTLKPKELPGAPPPAPKGDKGKATPSTSGAPLPFQQTESPPKPLEVDDAWCGVCGGLLYSGPAGISCKSGHKAPPQVTWDGAAGLLYDRGAMVVDAAELMEAEREDVAAYFHEREKAPPVAAIPEEDRLAILKAFAQNTPIEEVGRFFTRVPVAVLEALRDEDWAARENGKGAALVEGSSSTAEPEEPVVEAPPEPERPSEPAEAPLEQPEPTAEEPPKRRTRRTRNAGDEALEYHAGAAKKGLPEPETPVMAANLPEPVIVQPDEELVVNVEARSAPAQSPPAVTYETIGRAYVAAKIAGLTVEQYLEREREELARLARAIP